jgi:uncharacterized protein (UPF0335 family)
MWLQQQGNKLDQSILNRLIERIEKLEEKIKLLERKRINQKDTKNVI